MTKEKHIHFFSEELQTYTNFNESSDLISSTQKNNDIYHVYLTDIKREYLTLAPKHSSIIIKELSPQQALVYKKLATNWSPYLETIYGVLEKDGHFISVNEFIESPNFLFHEERSINLEEYITHYGCFSEKDALVLLCQLCEGVKALEKLNLAHGDISPQNILLTDAPVWTDAFFPPQKHHASPYELRQNLLLKIVDFDISREEKRKDHEVTIVMGTKSFAAPEILDYRYPTDRIDIYSLGCILHYMITGKSPKEFDIRSTKKMISNATFRIIRHCTVSYEVRYKNATQLQKALLRQLHYPTNPLLAIIYQLPGFRTRKIWKAAIALYFYSAIILALIIPLFYNSSYKAEDLCVIVFFLLEIIFVCDAFHLGSLSMKYMYRISKYPPLRYLVKFVIFLIIFFVYGLVFTILY